MKNQIEVVLMEKSKFGSIKKYKNYKTNVEKYFDFLDDECKEEYKDASLGIRCYRFNQLDEFKSKLLWASCVSRESFIRGIHEDLTGAEFQKVKKDFKRRMEWNEDERKAFNL